MKERREEASLLEFEIQSHWPLPVQEAMPLGCPELPDRQGAESGSPRLGEKKSRAPFREGRPRGERGVGSWLLASASSHPSPILAVVCLRARRPRRASLCRAGAEDCLPWAPPGNCWPEVKLTCLQTVMSWMPMAPVQGNHKLCFLEQFFLFRIEAKKKKKKVT